MDDNTRIAMEAAAFRTLITHLQTRTDVQNIDLMILAGFCRNCLARWYREAGENMGEQLSDTAARAYIYGMPYREWQEKYQKPATPEQVAALSKAPGSH